MQRKRKPETPIVYESLDPFRDFIRQKLIEKYGNILQFTQKEKAFLQEHGFNSATSVCSRLSRKSSPSLPLLNAISKHIFNLGEVERKTIIIKKNTYTFPPHTV